MISWGDRAPISARLLGRVARAWYALLGPFWTVAVIVLILGLLAR